MPIRLIAGLGNPGAQYARTRHNIGWRVVEAFGQRHGARWKEERKFHARVAKLERKGEALWLAEPLTYMNDSGTALGQLMRYYKIEAAEAVVIFDEINLPLAGLKLSAKGSAGGHNGLASVLAHCGPQVVRLRIGIGGKPAPEANLKDWVLSGFTAEEAKVIEAAVPQAVEALECLLDHGLERAMNQFNTKVTTKPKPKAIDERNQDRPTPLPGNLHTGHPELPGGTRGTVCEVPRDH